MLFNSFFRFLLFGLLASTVACHSSEKAVEGDKNGKKNEKSISSEENKVRRIEPDRMNDTASKATLSESPGAKKLRKMGDEAAPGKDTVVIRMQRTLCFGKCPVDILTIRESGRAVYEGQKNVERKGMYQKTVQGETLQRILQKAQDIGFFELQKEYDQPKVTDIPSTILTIRDRGQSHRVKARYGVPDGLEELIAEIEKVIESEGWEERSDEE